LAVHIEAALAPDSEMSIPERQTLLLLHFLPPYRSSLNLAPLYPSTGRFVDKIRATDLWLDVVPLMLRARQFMIQGAAWKLRHLLPANLRDARMGMRIGLLAQLSMQADLVMHGLPKVGIGGRSRCL
jgi:hypothetical protein